MIPPGGIAPEPEETAVKKLTLDNDLETIMNAKLVWEIRVWADEKSTNNWRAHEKKIESASCVSRGA